LTGTPAPGRNALAWDLGTARAGLNLRLARFGTLVMGLNIYRLHSGTRAAGENLLLGFSAFWIESMSLLSAFVCRRE
jgi:hypothetical protein